MLNCFYLLLLKTGYCININPRLTPHTVQQTDIFFLLCIIFQVCNNEATCTCDATWAGTDCSMHDPPKEPPVIEDPGPKGS